MLYNDAASGPEYVLMHINMLGVGKGEEMKKYGITEYLITANALFINGGRGFYV